MPAAARLFELTGHPGLITTSLVPTVEINGLPAAVVDDVHTCLLPPVAGPHPTNTITKGSLTVEIGGHKAARQGDLTGCGAPITTGSPNVDIGD